MSLYSTSAQAPVTPGDVFKSDPSPDISTDRVTVTGGNYLLGTVLGKITAGTVPITGIAGTNTGNGTCASVTGGVDVQPGIYAVSCVLAETNGGLFQVKSPSGKLLGIARVGVAFTHAEINLTVGDGSTDYAAGDSFTVTVPAGSGKYAALDVNNVDGTYHAAAILADNVDASTADQAAPVKSRYVVVDADFLAWPDGITDAQKAMAIAELQARAVIIRANIQ